MSDIERRLREFSARLTQWWNSSSRSARRRGGDGTASMRRGAAEHVHRAASRMQDFRQSDRGQRAASKLSDLRASEAAKKAEAALRDLRTSETGKKAESALADLRQREPVKKAEESARKVMHDLFSNGSGGSDKTTSTPSYPTKTGPACPVPQRARGTAAGRLFGCPVKARGSPASPDKSHHKERGRRAA